MDSEEKKDLPDKRDEKNPRFVKAPRLVSAALAEVDVFNIIQNIYGPDRNWCCKIWRLREVFPNLNAKKELKMDWESDDGKKHWLKETLDPSNPEDVINPPLFIPFG